MIPRSPHHDRRGFSLPELILALVIGGVLIAILLPTLAQGRKRAVDTACLQTLRQYGTALFSYLGDHQRFPDLSVAGAKAQFDTWLIGGGYLEQTLRCPLATASDLAGDRNVHGNRPGFYYAGSHALCNAYPNLKGIPAPLSRVILAAEMYFPNEGFYSATHFNKTMWGTAGEVGPGVEGNARTPQYHGPADRRGLHCLMADGSVRLVVPVAGDWRLEPVKAPLKGVDREGFFFLDNHFLNLKNGQLRPE